MTGYAVLILSLGGIGSRMQWLWMEGVDQVKNFVLVPGVL